MKTSGDTIIASRLILLGVVLYYYEGEETQVAAFLFGGKCRSSLESHPRYSNLYSGF